MKQARHKLYILDYISTRNSKKKQNLINKTENRLVDVQGRELGKLTEKEQKGIFWRREVFYILFMVIFMGVQICLT